ncbi:uncharacterized protein BO66DRAFT_439177 [Aspergillus aculeatinus CBS 121060]|uniref:Uncharacterized protein n=1 Tax=Aspergillus aculeatinus CBS 121060 TaxID=1448322 RepID=A0ACD1H7R2_9EURO|nr:hypothetical protein BO66DRAFT_439177 [Aspergillus aculeatinus CBS 121060]RAH69440.1 hypothetical protein BO66DRAFT_439177 [Aspergillus aculeatinus CBS 121060]
MAGHMTGRQGACQTAWQLADAVAAGGRRKTPQAVWGPPPTGEPGRQLASRAARRGARPGYVPGGGPEHRYIYLRLSGAPPEDAANWPPRWRQLATPAAGAPPPPSGHHRPRLGPGLACKRSVARTRFPGGLFPHTNWASGTWPPTGRPPANWPPGRLPCTHKLGPAANWPPARQLAWPAAPAHLAAARGHSRGRREPRLPAERAPPAPAPSPRPAAPARPHTAPPGCANWPHLPPALPPSGYHRP